MMRLGQYHRRHPDLRGVFSVLVPYSWFQILWYFYIYGFLGWCSEVAFAAVAHGKFVNRGFVNGPICSIYGFGVMSVLLVLGPLKSSFWLLFGGSVLFTSAIEYLTGWVLEKVFHDKWWDYYKRPLNIKGYVCLEFSVLWLGAARHVQRPVDHGQHHHRHGDPQAAEEAARPAGHQGFAHGYLRRDRRGDLYSRLGREGPRHGGLHRREGKRRGDRSTARREELLGQRNIVHERIAQAFPALREGKTNGPAFTRVHEHAQRRKQLAKALKAKARELKNKAKDRS